MVCEGVYLGQPKPLQKSPSQIKFLKELEPNKEVQKSINVIMDFDGNNSHWHLQKIKGNTCPK